MTSSRRRSWEFRRHDEVMAGLTYASEKSRYLRMIEMSAEPEEYLTALQFLSACLYRCCGQKVVILIDEYDVPLESAYFGGFYPKMIGLIRSLMESALKTNESLEFAVLTGCLRISRESIFTGLNNLKIFTIASGSYAEYFGFTPEEVSELLQAYHLQQKEAVVREWYDGYRFGETEVYNPWSVLNYVEAAVQNDGVMPAAYWSNTSSNNIVRRLVEKADMMTRQEIETRIEGKTIWKPLHEDVTYEDVESSQDHLWNFLYFTGYLKCVSEQPDGELRNMELAIPNREVRSIYKNTILRWFDEKVSGQDMSCLYRAILEGKPEEMEQILSKNLMETISFYDYQESFYHGFLAGLLKNMKDYVVLSNREAGCGRPDLVVRHPSIRGKAVILELKVAKSVGELEKKCGEALRQIEAGEYDQELRREGYRDIRKYGVAFYRKECMVKMGQEPAL